MPRRTGGCWTRFWLWWQAACWEPSPAAGWEAWGWAAGSCRVPRADNAAPYWHRAERALTRSVCHTIYRLQIQDEKKKDRAFTSRDPWRAARGDGVSVCCNAPLQANRGVIAERVGPALMCPVLRVADVLCCLKGHLNSQRVPLPFYGSFNSCPALTDDSIDNRKHTLL